MIESSLSSPDAYLEEFSSRFTKQAGVIYPAKDPDDAVQIVNGLIKSRGKGESCCSDDIEISYNNGKTNISERISTDR